MITDMRFRLPKGLKLFSGIVTATIALGVLFFQINVSAIARGYSTNDSGLQSGMVVVLSADSSNAGQVERATQANTQRIVGVVATIEGSLITVTAADTKVLVESEGEVDAYVTDANGDVKKGDSLVLSHLKGILMKGNGDPDLTVVGIVSADPSAETAEAYDINDGSSTKSVKITKVKINLNRQGASDANKTETSLSRLGRAVAGKDISEIRILLAVFIFLLVLVAEGGILYAGISSAISAVGRNPLARKIIRKELFRVVIIAISVLLIGLAAIYGILWV